MLLRSQPQLSPYMALAPEEKLKYPLGGPAALEAFNGGKEGFEAPLAELCAQAVECRTTVAAHLAAKVDACTC